MIILDLLNVNKSVSLFIYPANYLPTNIFINKYLPISISLLLSPCISLSLPCYIYLYHFILLTLSHSLFLSLSLCHSLSHNFCLNLYLCISLYYITLSLTFFISLSQFLSNVSSFFFEVVCFNPTNGQE